MNANEQEQIKVALVAIAELTKEIKDGVTGHSLSKRLSVAKKQVSKLIQERK